MYTKLTINAGFFLIMLFFGCVQAKNRGSQNLGNSCYFNATIQAFSHIEPLNDLLRKYRGSLESFPACYLEVVEELKKTTDPTAIEPRFLYTMTMSEIFRKPGQYKQEDAGELVTYLLDSVAKSVKKIQNPPEEYLDILGVWITSTVTCPSCLAVSEKREWTIPLCTELRNETTSLEACLDNTFQKEVLNEDNKWWCGKCRQWVRATKQLLLSKAPKVLVIQLKRFFTNYEHKPPRLEKNSHAVSFPLNIIRDQKVYELRSFIVHGGSTEGGHYWAYGREGDFNGHWYRYDDGSVPVESTVAVRNIASSGLEGTATPYILIYEENKLEGLTHNLRLLQEKLRSLSDKLRKLKTPTTTTLI